MVYPLTPVFVPGELHGQRSLVGYIPWDRKESDMTERLTLSHFSLVTSPPKFGVKTFRF